jgi:signal transduction histidine kinase
MQHPGKQAEMAPALTEGASFRWLNLSVYLCVTIGCLSAILTAPHLHVGTLLLVIGSSALWTLIYLLIARGHVTMHLSWILALTALACVAVLASLLGSGLDWLLPVITVGLISMSYPQPRFILPVTLALWLLTVLIETGVDGRLDMGVWLQLLMPFAFSLIFAYSAGRIERSSKQTRQLLATLARSNAELETAHRQLQAYAAQVEELSITRERNRIAREIHDTLGHALTLLAVQLETAARLEERGEPGLREELLEARRVTKECLAEVRLSVAALRPDAVALSPFEEALRRLVAEFEATCRETAVTLDADDVTQPLSSEQRMVLYRCAQEALTNVRKHARATKVLLRLSTSEERAELTVLDNGQGASQPHETTSGFGLLGMRERVALLGGTLRTGPEPGRGWRLEVIVPLGRAPAATTATTATIANVATEDQRSQTR